MILQLAAVKAVECRVQDAVFAKNECLGVHHLVQVAITKVKPVGQIDLGPGQKLQTLDRPRGRVKAGDRRQLEYAETCLCREAPGGRPASNRGPP